MSTIHVTNISASDYLNYRNDSIKRSESTDKHILKFVTYNDSTIKALAESFNTICAGMTAQETAIIVLSYTQSVPYQYDSDFIGQDEYWKYPLETLFDECGDCEDTSFLFCAMAKAGGYDCAIIIYSGHMAAGIHVDGITGNGYYDYNNTRYYYSETTATGWAIGDTPNNSLYLQKIIPVS